MQECGELQALGLRTRFEPLEVGSPSDQWEGVRRRYFQADTYYLPQFMAHPIFPHLLELLGSYEAEALFPPEALNEARANLIRTMQASTEMASADTLADLSA